MIDRRRQAADDPKRADERQFCCRSGRPFEAGYKG